MLFELQAIYQMTSTVENVGRITKRLILIRNAWNAASSDLMRVTTVASLTVQL